MERKIVDLSHHNEDIDWSIAHQYIEMAIIRVQYGSNLIDRKYQRNITGCKAYGIPFGHYAYGCFVSVSDAIVEAKDFLSRIDSDAKFLVLDVEDDTVKAMESRGNLHNIAEASQAFIDTCKAAGYKVGFYVSHHLYNEYNLQSVQADFIWIPRYGTNNGTPQVRPDFSCDIWQYTDKGKMAGVPGDVDMNLLEGDKALEWYIGNHQTLVPPSSSISGKRVVSKVDQLRFYSKPSWADVDVAGIVTKGLGFEIIDKVDVNSSPQYKVHNSKGNVYYITASPKYIEVR
ncbi:GH25 family lysozyme [Bacillus cereus]|nr:GH25 family lysozyme [Bacillus cereus]MEB9569686.1 GH25 family lysozyme [Bacillus cereus]